METHFKLQFYFEKNFDFIMKTNFNFNLLKFFEWHSWATIQVPQKQLDNFRLPQMETASGQRSVSFRVDQVGNSLDKDLKGETSLGSLKKNTKQAVNVEGHSTLCFDLIFL